MDIYLISFKMPSLEFQLPIVTDSSTFVQTKVTRLCLDFNLRHHEPGGSLYHCAAQPT